MLTTWRVRFLRWRAGRKVGLDAGREVVNGRAIKATTDPGHYETPDAEPRHATRLAPSTGRTSVDKAAPTATLNSPSPGQASRRRTSLRVSTRALRCMFMKLAGMGRDVSRCVAGAVS